MPNRDPKTGRFIKEEEEETIPHIGPNLRIKLPTDFSVINKNAREIFKNARDRNIFVENYTRDLAEKQAKEYSTYLDRLEKARKFNLLDILCAACTGFFIALSIFMFAMYYGLIKF